MLHDLTVDSVIRGYHIYNQLLKRSYCEHEPGNEKDHFAVAMMLHDDIIGHVPRTIQHICWYFIQHRSMIDESLL